MSSHKFYYLIITLLCAISFTACSDDDDKTSIPDIKLAASLSSFSEGIDSFDEEGGILSVSQAGTLTSGITFTDANGTDMNGISLKAQVTSSDKIWCIANCSETRLSLSVAKNTGADTRQTIIEISALHGDQVLDTYSLIIVQKGEEKADDSKNVANITTFMIPGQETSKIEDPIITVIMPAGTDLTALTPVIIVSPGATISPASGEVQNFNNVVEYIVISGDEKNVKKYMVVVTVRSGGGGDKPGGNEQNPDYRMFDMVKVEAGSFIIGKDMSGTYVDRENSHKVNISAFEIGRYEVTQREFLDIMGYNPSTFTKNDLYPVNKVTLYEAMLYCNKLSERNGLKSVYTFSNQKWDDTNKELLEADVARDKTANGYRLPTSAEWEYAAKGGKDYEKYPYKYAGSNDINEVCWYQDNATIDETPVPHAVGLKKPNSLGIYDMSGNGEEYTGEWFLQLDYLSDAEETDPWGPEKPRDMNERFIISRGGCFDTYDDNCAVNETRILGAHIKTNMNFPGGEIWFDVIGFRVVRSLK